MHYYIKVIIFITKKREKIETVAGYYKHLQGQTTTKNRKNDYEIPKFFSSLPRVIVLCLNPYFKK